MGSKIGNFFIGGSQEHFFGSKTVPFVIGHPPTYTSVYMCARGFRGPKSSNRIELSRFVIPLHPSLGGGALSYEFRNVLKNFQNRTHPVIEKVGGGCLGVHGGCPHMHARRTHTCIELMAASRLPCLA